MQVISISSMPICGGLPQLPASFANTAGGILIELDELLRKKNGFYAFESALHVLPSNCLTALDIEKWNSDELWRKEYDAAVSGYLFFAEDLFGNQFALRDGKVYRFDPETAESEEMANSIEEWASKVLSDFEYETGYPLAHEWQEKNGPLPYGKRLVPKTPFMLGGKYEVENLYEADAVEGMLFRADLWKQTKDLPEGASVRLKVVE